MLHSGVYKLEITHRLNGSTAVKILSTIKIAPPDAFKMIGFEFVVKSDTIPKENVFWAYVGTTAFVPILEKVLIDILDEGSDDSSVEEETLKKSSKIEVVRVRKVNREVSKVD